jgi:UDP-N-acetylmuramate--alanine ligase
MFRKARRLHFVGIGGSGMSGIAEVLVNLRYRVSGSDLAINAATRRLKKLGAKVQRGHAAENVRNADVVVISSAVHEDNPEVIEARRSKIPVIPRAEMLAELMRLKYGVAVAGAHGKTTTTGMVAEVLTAGGIDPTIVIGGRVRSLRSGARLGRGEMMVAEADESDGSFLKMKPTIAVVTNVDREHLDHYADFAAIKEAFVRFLSRVPFYGAAVVCLDDPNLREILPRVDRKIIGYGLSSDADVTATDIELQGRTASYVACRRGKRLGPIRLAVPGRHSVSNSLAAIAVGLELDVPFVKIARGLSRFRGVDRRFQIKGKAFGALVVDDYAHHPTEIEATLAAAREGFGTRTLVVFQPHRFTRTRALLEEFGRAFVLADKVVITDVYPAGEPPIPGVNGAAVAESLARHGHPSVVHESSRDEISRWLRETIQPGDLVLTLGAGDVWKVGEALLRVATQETGRRKTRQKGSR